MTLVFGFRGRDSVVLSADSQRTQGQFRDSIPKLFRTPSGIVWGTAGSIAIQQEVFAALQELQITSFPSREEGRDAAVQALVEGTRKATAQMEDPPPAALAAEGLFGWYSAAEKRTFLVQAFSSGHSEFRPVYAAVGTAHVVNLANFALSSSEHLDYLTLPSEAAKMVAYNIAAQIIKAAASGVGPPVQIAVASARGTELVPSDEVRALEDTVAAFLEYQRDYLARDDEPGPERDTGVRPKA